MRPLTPATVSAAPPGEVHVFDGIDSIVERICVDERSQYPGAG
jgi:hypothetical protein